MTPDDVASFQWLNPANYHTRCSEAIAIAVAGDILLGATWQSATKKYGVRHRALEWMRWGYEAAQRDADETDHHAMYLNWYLKLSQALGYAEVVAQHAIYKDTKQWWLTHNPEAAADWSGVVALQSATLPDADATTAVDATTIAPVDLKAPTIREVLHMLIDAGANVRMPDPDGTVVESDKPTESGTGTDG